MLFVLRPTLSGGWPARSGLGPLFSPNLRSGAFADLWSGLVTDLWSGDEASGEAVLFLAGKATAEPAFFGRSPR